MPDFGKLLPAPGWCLVITGSGGDDIILNLGTVLEDTRCGEDNEQGGNDQLQQPHGFQLGPEAPGDDGKHQAGDDITEGPDQQPVADLSSPILHRNHPEQSVRRGENEL